MIRKIKNIGHLFRAILANIIYGFPAKKLKVIGITGTDGKTTTCFYLYNILLKAGKKVAVITTIEARFNDKVVDVGLHVTNPDAIALPKLLRQIANEGIEYVVLEVTSHGIDQHRIWGIPFMINGLTNITHEHLDYHKTFEQYQKTKLKFVLSAPKLFLAEKINRDVISGITINLSGKYNIDNAKLAAEIARFVGVSVSAVKEGIEGLTNLRGRMEVVYDQVFKVIVDFAHTPNGLEKALTEAKNQAQNSSGRVISVFGCAGERDTLKRPVMGEIAGRLADLVVITSEDPRSEDPNDIATSIAVGLEKSGKIKDQNYWIILDRKDAIENALKTLVNENDVVMITGKGHEQSMNINGIEQLWDDREVVKQILQVN